MNKNVPYRKKRGLTNFDEEDSEVVEHKREVKRMIEDKLERKRLKDELEDFDGELDDEFDWDEFDLNKGR
jgi:hypothetical protein